MLSYRHGYHAGNHADVLKHWVLVLCLQHLKQKEKPFSYIDTHAGAGCYALDSIYANKTAEYQDGIVKLWQQAASLPPSFKDYVQLIKELNGHGPLKSYPGSPWLAANLLRLQDNLRLVEMHPSDIELLQNNLGGDKQTKIISGDGFKEIKAMLPPASRRGLILIDPSYEQKQDYQQTVNALREGLKRFATGTYVVWYPLINSVWAQRFSSQLQALPCDQWIDAQLIIKRPPERHGMFGSGLFVINPPWRLQEQLAEGLPVLAKLLAQDESASFQVQSSTNN